MTLPTSCNYLKGWEDSAWRSRVSNHFATFQLIFQWGQALSSFDINDALFENIQEERLYHILKLSKGKFSAARPVGVGGRQKHSHWDESEPKIDKQMFPTRTLMSDIDIECIIPPCSLLHWIPQRRPSHSITEAAAWIKNVPITSHQTNNYWFCLRLKSEPGFPQDHSSFATFLLRFSWQLCRFVEWSFSVEILGGKLFSSRDWVSTGGEKGLPLCVVRDVRILTVSLISFLAPLTDDLAIKAI